MKSISMSILLLAESTAAGGLVSFNSVQSASEAFNTGVDLTSGDDISVEADNNINLRRH